MISNTICFAIGFTGTSQRFFETCTFILCMGFGLEEERLQIFDNISSLTPVCQIWAYHDKMILTKQLYYA